MKHSPGQTGPECGTTPFQFPQDIAVTVDEKITCRACREILVARGECPECGVKGELTWGTHPRNKTGGVVDGRLRMYDVETIFYLACDFCSETLIARVDPDEVAAALTKLGWRP